MLFIILLVISINIFKFFFFNYCLLILPPINWNFGSATSYNSYVLHPLRHHNCQANSSWAHGLHQHLCRPRSRGLLSLMTRVSHMASLTSMMNVMGKSGTHLGLVPPFLSIVVFRSEELLRLKLLSIMEMAYTSILEKRFTSFKSLAELITISKHRRAILKI